MAVHVEIEKNFRGFSLKTAFDSKSSATGILGASGSGKSMTLRCICGIEKPDKGRIIVDGITYFDAEKKINLSPQKRNAGYLFQNLAGRMATNSLGIDYWLWLGFSRHECPVLLVPASLAFRNCRFL